MNTCYPLTFHISTSGGACAPCCALRRAFFLSLTSSKRYTVWGHDPHGAWGKVTCHPKDIARTSNRHTTCDEYCVRETMARGDERS